MPKIPKLTDNVAARLRKEILAGKWADGGMPSERALSGTLRVARLTARRALKRLCAEHLIEARPGRGYVMAPGAAALQPQPLGREVLFFFVDSSGRMSLDPVDTAIMNGASAEARSRGLELFATCQEPAVFRRIVEERKGRSLRGILLDWARRDIAEFLLEQGVPFVVVEDDIEGLPVAAVIQDNAAGTRAVLQQMAERGHRRIGLVVNTQQSVHPVQRLAAYREFMLRSGLGVAPELIAQDESGTDGGRRAAARLLDLAPEERPTAIYVASRGMLDGAIAEMRSRGLACPNDISLATWGEPGTGEPAGDVKDVTYAAWDRQELGRVAMLALEERIRAGRPERMVFRIEARVADRGSVAGKPDTGDRRG
jgi:LacI family transcriptional regulator